MSFVHQHIDHFLESTTGDAYCKNTKGVYLDVNDIFLRIAGVNSHQDVLGGTDLDLVWHQQANIMMQNDKDVILQNCTKTVLEPSQLQSGEVYLFLSYKTPLQSHTGKTIGIFGISFLIGKADDLLTAFNQLNTIGKDSQTQNLIKIYSPRLLVRKYKLSTRQRQCLDQLVRGKSMKEIANALQLSPKTVEHYLEATKIKLNCSTRSQLIEKALSMGFGR